MLKYVWGAQKNCLRDGSFEYPQHMLWLLSLFSYTSMLKYVWGAQKNCLRDGSFEYQQHMLWLRNNKMNFNYTLLSGGLQNLVTYTPSR